MNALAGRRLLVADDSADNTAMVQMCLEALGALVEVAADGNAALAALARQRPDVVLLDLGLGGGMDGYQVLERMRATPATATVPVLAFTASVTSGDRERVLKAGFDGFVAKPVELPALVGELGRAMAGARKSSGF